MIAIRRSRRLVMFALPSILLASASLQGAELSVGNVTMLAGASDAVVVSGTVASEFTYGVTILVEILPRGGNIGSVTFTASPPPDIGQTGDPWPGAGRWTSGEMLAVSRREVESVLETIGSELDPGIVAALRNHYSAPPPPPSSPTWPS